jgi:hypothetical protein
MVIFDQRERVAPVADGQHRHRIPIVEYGSERTSVPFVYADIKQKTFKPASLVCNDHSVR